MYHSLPIVEDKLTYLYPVDLVEYTSLDKLEKDIVSLAKERYRPGVDEILMRVSHELGMDEKTVAGRSQELPVSLVRQIYCYWGRVLGFKFREIGEPIHRQYNSVIPAAKTVQDCIEINDSAVIEKVMEAGKGIRRHIIAKFRLYKDEEATRNEAERFIYIPRKSRIMIKSEEITTTDDLDRLYELRLACAKEIGEIHAKLTGVKSEKEKIAVKSELALAYATQEVVLHRIDDLKLIHKHEGNHQAKVNYNFRMAAKVRLDKPLYEELLSIAHKSRREIKP
jgi:hypothetical protein